MFGVGMFINIQSDHILTHLRKPGETDNKIPTGGLFNYVTGTNFFGEILEWTGFALTSYSDAAAVFAAFSAIFLSTRAWHHHKYYLKKI
jgi:3-oxo-5-alpha-steroid 4-dehydrogenase 1